MPGVPSGKGCNACASQKKKCDQGKPACARCTRLRIPCIGSGQQRYKFKEVNLGKSQTALELRCSQSRSSSRAVSRSPSNEESSLLSELVHKLRVTDLRYDICWAYGGLFKEIPKRLGTNPALDASVRALVSALPGLGEARKSPESFARYGSALMSLKACLEDPVTVQSSSTLCAIYLIWICQSWLCNDEDMVISGHGSGIVKLLALAPYRNSEDEFDRTVLLTVAGPVLFESLVDPAVKLNPWLKQLVLDTEHPIIDDDRKPFHANGRYQSQVGRIMGSIVRLPAFLQYDPELYDEIVFTHQDVQLTSARLRERMLGTIEAVGQEVYLETPKRLRIKVSPSRLHAFYQRMYGVFLNFEIMLNGILQAYRPGNLVLEQEAFKITQEIVDLSLAASTLRPLGAGWIPMCLVSAWGATTDCRIRSRLEDVWIKCWSDYSKLPLHICGKQMEGVFDQLRLAVAMAPQGVL